MTGTKNISKNNDLKNRLRLPFARFPNSYNEVYINLTNRKVSIFDLL